MPCAAVVRGHFASRAGFLVLFAVAGATARADELPKDTNSLESLTPQQAQRLAAEFPGVQVEFAPTRSTTIETTDRGLPLCGLRSLDAETAKALAAYAGELVLGGLSSVDAATAEALTHGKASRIYLHGLTELDADTARVLAASKKVEAWLSRLATLDDATAAALANFTTPDLHLDGLTAISPQVAESLSRSAACNLHLNGVKTLSVAEAKALARFGSGRDGTRLLVQGLTELDPETAATLAASKAWTGYLPQLAKLDAATAKALTAFAGPQLSLDGIAKLDSETARMLADCKCRVLSLAGLATLDAETARTLVKLRGSALFLGGLTSLDATTAEVLAESTVWIGSLPRITALESRDSVAVARALARHEGVLSINNLKRVSANALMALLEKQDVVIPLIDTIELIPEPDGGPNEDFIIPEGFRARQRQQHQQP